MGETSASTIRLLLAAGWLAHAIAWLVAIIQVRGEAAAAHEWSRELALRALMAALLVWSLIAPSGTWLAVPTTLVVVLLLLFLAAQAAAIVARVQLGRRWGIGIEPRACESGPVRTGLYRWLSHPIYLCCAVALSFQTVLLSNPPSLVLLLGTCIVTVVKSRREAALLQRANTVAPASQSRRLRSRS